MCRSARFMPTRPIPTAIPIAVTSKRTLALGCPAEAPRGAWAFGRPGPMGVFDVAERSGVDAFSISASVRITSSSAGLSSSSACGDRPPGHSGCHGSKAIPESVGQPRRCHKLPEYEQEGYALVRSAGRRWRSRDSSLGESVGAGNASTVFMEGAGSSAVSLFMRGGFRSQRQNTHRVVWV